MAMEVEQNQNHQLGFPFWKPLRRRFGPESPFFAHGNLERELLAKQLALELTEEKQQLEKWMQEEEGRNHSSLRDCPIASQLWQRLLKNRISNDLYNMNVKEWMSENLGSKMVFHGVNWCTIFGVSVSAIRRNRNEFIFLSDK